ncbi:hypothetical protein DWW96_00360 [Eubacterium sp. AF17-7]|nr:hypothetical protein DWW96_00360 [Eubacterium sp. AF17-7]
MFAMKKSAGWGRKINVFAMKISAGWGKENQRVCYENICRLGGRKINVFAMKKSVGWGRNSKYKT